MPTSPSRLSKGCAKRQRDLEDDYHGKQRDGDCCGDLHQREAIPRTLTSTSQATTIGSSTSPLAPPFRQ